MKLHVKFTFFTNPKNLTFMGVTSFEYASNPVGFEDDEDPQHNLRYTQLRTALVTSTGYEIPVSFTVEPTDPHTSKEELKAIALSKIQEFISKDT